MLGVSRGASQDQIKKAYFKKVKDCHPDVNKSPDATDKFRVVQEAYEILGNASSRREYDSIGTTQTRSTSTTSPKPSASRPGQSRRENAYNQSPFFDEDFFSQFFSTFTSEQKFQVKKC